MEFPGETKGLFFVGLGVFLAMVLLLTLVPPKMERGEKGANQISLAAQKVVQHVAAALQKDDAVRRTLSSYALEPPPPRLPDAREPRPEVLFLDATGTPVAGIASRRVRYTLAGTLCAMTETPSSNCPITVLGEILDSCATVRRSQAEKSPQASCRYRKIAFYVQIFFEGKDCGFQILTRTLIRVQSIKARQGKFEVLDEDAF